MEKKNQPHTYCSHSIQLTHSVYQFFIPPYTPK